MFQPLMCFLIVQCALFIFFELSPFRERWVAFAQSQPLANPSSAASPPTEQSMTRHVIENHQKELEDSSPRVRIGLRLTQFRKVVTKGRDGRSETRFIPTEPLRHVLRARLNKTNHFFVGEWHIESVPTKWIRKLRRYDLILKIYRRYGAFGQLEESLGAINVSGVLEEESPRLFVLIGVARKRLRDKFQNPYLDVVAGFNPPEKKLGIARGAAPVTIPEPPIGSRSEAILRGRF